MAGKKDIIFIGLLLVVAVVFWLLLDFFGNDGSRVVITVNQKKKYEYSLDKDRKINVKYKNGENTIVIKDGKVSVDLADCPDQICVRHKKICKKGESIICLPHKLVVEIKGGKENAYDGITR